MLMTAADVAAIAKPWELQHETAKQVADEFFDQGDMERMQLGINPMWMMDRERKDELPQMQVRIETGNVCFCSWSSNAVSRTPTVDIWICYDV